MLHAVLCQNWPIGESFRQTGAEGIMNVIRWINVMVNCIYFGEHLRGGGKITLSIEEEVFPYREGYIS